MLLLLMAHTRLISPSGKEIEVSAPAGETRNVMGENTAEMSLAPVIRAKPFSLIETTSISLSPGKGPRGVNAPEGDTKATYALFPPERSVVKMPLPELFMSTEDVWVPSAGRD